jgi:hypothetical protein
MDADTDLATDMDRIYTDMDRGTDRDMDTDTDTGKVTDKVTNHDCGS